MTDAPAAPDPTANAQAWAQRCMPLMEVVLDQTADMARMIHTRTVQVFEAVSQPEAEPADLALSRLGLAFDRVSRSFRQVVALGGKVAADLDGQHAAAQARRTDAERAAKRAEDAARKAAEDARRAEADERGYERKRQAAVLLEDQIKAVSPKNEREDLLGELERDLRNGYDNEDCADLPISEIINRICREIGIAADWSKIPKADIHSAFRRHDTGQQVFATWPEDGNPPPRPEPPKPMSARDDYFKHRYANEPPDP